MRQSIIILCAIIAAAQAVPTVKWADLKPRKVHIAQRAPLQEVTRGRIIGGTLAAAGDLPFQVGMFMDGSFFCGGSLISETMVLSAAHCTQRVRSFEVYLGALRVNDPTEDGRVLVVSNEEVTHEDYNGGQLINDIGLVILPDPVALTDRIGLIRLTSSTAGDFSGEVGTVSGWGIESDESPSIADDLQYTQVNIISNAECSLIWGTIPDTQLCVDTNGGLNGPCLGDSGGPLTVTEADGVRTQVGVVSYVSGSGCESGIPSGFTRVTEYVDWIFANGGPAPRP